MWKGHSTKVYLQCPEKRTSNSECYIFKIQTEKDDGWEARWKNVIEKCRLADGLAAQIEAFDLVSSEPVLTVGVIMEYVEGQTVAKFIDDEEKEQKKPSLTFSTILDALSKLHARGVRHGDPNPRNMIFLPDGSLKFVDLGPTTESTKPRLFADFFALLAYSDWWHNYYGNDNYYKHCGERLLKIKPNIGAWFPEQDFNLLFEENSKEARYLADLNERCLDNIKIDLQADIDDAKGNGKLQQELLAVQGMFEGSSYLREHYINQVKNRLPQIEFFRTLQKYGKIVQKMRTTHKDTPPWDLTLAKSVYNQVAFEIEFSMAMSYAHEKISQEREMNILVNGYLNNKNDGQSLDLTDYMVSENDKTNSYVKKALWKFLEDEYTIVQKFPEKRKNFTEHLLANLWKLKQRYIYPKLVDLNKKQNWKFSEITAAYAQFLLQYCNHTQDRFKVSLHEPHWKSLGFANVYVRRYSPLYLDV